MIKKLGFSIVFLIFPVVVFSAEVALPMVSLDKEPVSAKALFGEVPDELIVNVQDDLYGIPDPELKDEEDLSQFLVKDNNIIKPVAAKRQVAKRPVIAPKIVEKEMPNVVEKNAESNPENIKNLEPRKLASNIWFKKNPVADVEIQSQNPKSEIINQNNLVADHLVSKKEMMEFANILKKEIQSVKEKIDERNTPEFDYNFALNNAVESSDVVDETLAYQDVQKVDEIIDVPENKEIKFIEPVKNTRELVDNESVDFTKMSPDNLKKAFYKTYVSENKHLSAYADFDTESDMNNSGDLVYRKVAGSYGSNSGDDSKVLKQVPPLEIKVGFNDEDSSLSRDNYRLLSEYAAMMASNPQKAIQISMSERVAKSYNSRKLAAKRLAIVEQVLRDSGVSEKKIMPVLSNRDDDAFVLRIISMDQYKTLVEKKRDLFGDEYVTKTSGKSLSW